MHLTNYSVNKNSTAFLENRDADIDDYGSKWSARAIVAASGESAFCSDLPLLRSSSLQLLALAALSLARRD